MECSFGDIDLNRAQTEAMSDDETEREDHGSTEGMPVPQQEDGLGMVGTAEDSNTAQIEDSNEVNEKPEEEPEEGEISDHNDGQETDNGQKDAAVDGDTATPVLEPAPTSSSYGSRWSSRSNGESRHGAWTLRSEASAYSVQPDKFYQFAWAKGVQESPVDSLGDSLQDERLPKSRKTGDSLALHRSGSGDRKSGWIVGDRGIEYAKIMRSDDGYFFLQEGGDPSDQRRRRERSDRGSSERGGKSMSDKLPRDYRNHSEERSYTYDRERRRLESRRCSRDSRRRDGRGEGDLEEGEIELKQAILAEKAAMNRQMKGRDKEVERLSDKAYLKSTGTVAYVFLSEPQKDRLFLDIASNVRNVSVKDAQKSFLGVCHQLRRALRALRDLNKDLSGAQGKHIEGQQRKALALTRDTFSGIRAAYAVRNTAVGKEQEQDTNVFPRLLELARNRCESLFTSKQIQELESMMQALGYRSIVNELPKLSSMANAFHQTEKGEERDLKFGDSSGNTSATTQLESESTTDISANARTLELGDEAEQSLNLTVDLNICELSAEALSAVDSSTAGALGFGGWFSYGPEQGDAQEYYDAKETESLPAPKASAVVDLSKDQSKCNPLLSREVGIEDRSDVLGSSKTKNAQGINEPGFVAHFDPVRALPCYQEKFATKSQPTHSRLPSPTPSGEGGTIENSSNDVSTVGAHSICVYEGKQVGKDEELRQDIVPNMFPPPIAPPEKEDRGRAAPSELTLFPRSEIATVNDGNSEGLQTKMVPPRGSKKSRDPRRRLDSHPIDLERPQSETGGFEGSGSQESSMVLSREPIGPKQQASQASQESLSLNGELVSLLTLATGGGWPSEQMQTTSTTADAGLHMNVDSSNSIEGPYLKKRQIEILNEESSSKRPRTAVILKEGVVARRPKGLDLETVEPGDISKQAPSETISSQSGVLLEQSTSVLESVVSGSLKPRMKPRDPRRALLGSILEQSKIMVVAKGDGSSAASSTEGVPQAKRDAVRSMSEPAFIGNITDKPGWTNSTVKNDNSHIERAAGSANVLTIARTGSMVKNGTLPIAGSTGLLRDSDLSSNNGRPDDLSKNSKVTAVEAKVNVARPPGRFDLNISAAKQRDNLNHWDHLEPLFEGLDEKQKQAVRQERVRRIEEQSRMFVAKKLCLVLDLDHTLLNSAKFSEIEVDWEAKLQANELTERNKFGKEGSNRRELYRFQHMGMWTKLRPGIWKFLARASHLYELHVYTMGNKAYATEMAKLLDPTGTLFAGRVISKGDDGDTVDGDDRPPKSKDLDGVLGMESAVVIIDDSARVWPHHRHNLIVVERYMYFPCSRKQFGLPGPSLLEVGHDEREQDGMLASALMVIEKIHYNFFSNPRLHEVDVRDILAKEQCKVLSGCKLVFSRVFPQGEIQPHLHPLWQLAEQFGAVCSMGIDDGVTHVVAISLGTEKVNWALSTGRFVVRPSWLEASAILYRRASERDFSVTA